MIKNFLNIFFAFSFINIYSQEPVAQPYDLEFLGVKAYGMSVSFTDTLNSNYLILRSNAPISDVPVDGVDYEKGEWIGSSKILGKGTNSFYTLRESVANTTYHFAIYAYNPAGFEYKTTNPLIGQITTKGVEVGNYYDNLSINEEGIIDDLSTKLYNHIYLNYSDFDDKVVNNIFRRDTTGIFDYVVKCEYSNNLYQFNGNINFGTYNREHVTPKSWMPSDPSSFDFEGSDYHNLFLVKASVNSKRLNYPIGEVVNQTWSDNASKFGTDVNNDNVFEPRENIKGNIARTMFYQILTYDGLQGSWAFDNLQTFGPDQDVDLLKQWHLQDPVDNFEIARNEYIYSVQNNRNPFVDFPDWVDCIDFKTLTLNGNCEIDTVIDIIKELKNTSDFNIYPNPVRDNFFLQNFHDSPIISLNLLNVNGEKYALNFEQKNIINVNLKNYPEGVYILQIITKNHIISKKIHYRK